MDAIREFNLLENTYGAAYGKRQGAQVSIVTDSGTNQVHGSAFEFLRNSALDSRNFFDQAHIPEFQRNDSGATLGGPLRRNKLSCSAIADHPVNRIAELLPWNIPASQSPDTTTDT